MRHHHVEQKPTMTMMEAPVRIVMMTTTVATIQMRSKLIANDGATIMPMMAMMAMLMVIGRCLIPGVIDAMMQPMTIE
jgi:hypothetical protein